MMKDNVLYQDNQCAMEIKKNGKNSCTGSLRHISIRYLFVKDRVDKGEVSIQYSATEYMLADFLQDGYKEKCFMHSGE